MSATPARPGRHDGVDAPGVRVARRVWFIGVERESADQEALRRAAEQGAQRVGLTFNVRRTKDQRVRGGIDKDRPYRVLSPRDARGLYESLHLSDCMVIASHTSFVKSDPSSEPATLRELIPLSDYVAHKAGFALVRGVGAVRTALGRFASWPPTDGCTSEHDPRALPLHIFDPSYSWPEPWTDQCIRDFGARYDARNGGRVDHAGRTWERPSALHGAAGEEREALRVAGTPLPLGYHWDVQRGRGKERITSSYEVWRLRHERCHVNVYPNGYVRGSKQAVRVWPT